MGSLCHQGQLCPTCCVLEARIVPGLLLSPCVQAGSSCLTPVSSLFHIHHLHSWSARCKVLSFTCKAFHGLCPLHMPIRESTPTTSHSCIGFFQQPLNALGFLLCCSPCWEVNNRTATLSPLPNPPFMLCFVLLPVKTLNMLKAEVNTYQHTSTVLWFLWSPHLSVYMCASPRSETMSSLECPQCLCSS